MKTTQEVRVFGVVQQFLKEGILLGVFVCAILLVLSGAAPLAADEDFIDPDPTTAGSLSESLQDSCGASVNHAECLNDGVRTPTAPSTGGDFLLFDDLETDVYLMDSITGAATTTQIQVFVYHFETNGNEAFFISLFNGAGTVQYGTEQQLTNRSVTAEWDSAIFSGTNFPLTQGELNDLTIQLECRRPGGGAKGDCTAYALYANVTYQAAIDVTVSATGTQQDLAIGTTSAHVGGSFVIKENTGSRNVTSIAINEAGTVDAQNDLDNIELWYELSTSSPYDCSEDSFDGNEIQFGTTDTDGFSAANGTSTFTGAVGISTAASMCVYTVLDVLNTATAGETIELQIIDPSTNVQGSASPNVRPTTTVTIAGTTILRAPDVRQEHYHWRLNDVETEAGASSATGDEDITFDAAAKETTYRLRFQINNAGNASADTAQYKIQYAENSGLCSTSGGWTDVGSTALWSMSDVALASDGDNTTNISTTTGGVTDGTGNTFLTPNGGFRDATNQTGNITLTDSDFVELEFSMQASSTITDGTTYCFRVIDGLASSTLDAYDVYPEATIAADVTVAASGTQPTTVNIPTDNNYGGTFVITDATAGAHNLDSITITASGTIDFVNDINDITLRYDLDTVAPYDCTGHTYNPADSVYGSVDTDGFSAAGTSTFTGTLSVSPTQAVCLHVEYDIDGDTSNGETLDIQMNDPSIEVVASGGTVAPSSPVAIDGVTTFVTYDVRQMHYHWRNDDGNEADPNGATSATGGFQDTVLEGANKNQNYRLRIGLSNEGGASSPTRQYQLQWAPRISSCDAAVGWKDIDVAGDDWSMSLSPNFNDATSTTNIPEGIGGVADEGSTYLFPNGGMKESSSETGNVTLASAEYVDLEYSIRASTTALEGSSYCFRIFDSLASSTIEAYDKYPEVTLKFQTDFRIQRGIADIVSGSTTATIVADVDYALPSASTSAFIRITNAHHTGGGPSAGTAGNTNSDATTAYISNPENITSSIAFVRGGTTGDTRIAWEIIEYQGAVGGENEMIVRDQGTVTYGAANLTVSTAAAPNVVDDADVVPFITGQFNPDTGRFDYNTGLSTSAWNAGTDTATFTRGEAGSDAAIVSYAIVEFTGTNWSATRTPDHTYTNVGTTETESISAVGSVSRAFIHAQHRAGTDEDQHGDYGHEVWLSGVGQVSFRLNGSAQTPGLHVSAAWVISNAQIDGDIMEVTRSNGTIPAGGGGLTTTNIPIGKTLDDISVSSIFMNSSNSGIGRSFPEPMVIARILPASTTAYELSVSDDSDANLFRTEIVEWPTAESSITQNHYQFFENNGLVTPTTEWPCELGPCGEDTEITGLDNPLVNGDTIRVRMSLQITAASLPQNVVAFKLQYGESSTVCTAIAEANWRDVGGIGSTTAIWRGTSTSATDGETLPTTLISFSDVSGTFEEENNSALNPNTVVVGNDIEYDWAIENNGAAQKTSYCFRMVEADGTILNGGFTRYPTLRTAGYGAESQTWRWFDDAENETPSVPLAATNTAPIDIAFDNTIQLRLILREVNGASEAQTKFRLEFSEFANFSTSTTVAEIGDCVDGASLWCYDDGGGVDNATITTSVISDADTCIGGVGAGCGTHNESGTSSSTSNHIHEAGDTSEFAFTIRHAGARVNRVYYFRAYDVANEELVPLGSGESYPSLMTEGASLVFTMNGIASSTVTEGVTLDIDTTPTTIGFGTVVPNTEVEGAHRLVVDANGTEGYKVYMYGTGDFQNDLGSSITPVTGTNASPTGWSTGCVVSADSCFGYHSGDDVLEGGSTRFSAVDTYARVNTTTPEEILFSSSPVQGETIDIIYKIQVGSLQTAGQYETGITYIATPIF